MRVVVIEDFNGYISFVTDPDTGDVKVFDNIEEARAEVKKCQNGYLYILKN